MKKVITLLLTVGLIAGSLALPAEAAKKKKKKKKPAVVSVDQKFFLHDTACDDPNTLSLTDGPDSSCWYVDSGPLYDIFEQAGLLDRMALSQEWAAAEGLPMKLDPSRHLTGEITTASGQCLTADACSPAGLGAGQATLDVFIIGVTAGEDVTIGEFTESYLVAPGATHTSKVDITLDPALAGKSFESFNVYTYLHGAAVGHGVISLDDPASFVTVPSFVKK